MCTRLFGKRIIISLRTDDLHVYIEFEVSLPCDYCESLRNSYTSLDSTFTWCLGAAIISCSKCKTPEGPSLYAFAQLIAKLVA